MSKKYHMFIFVLLLIALAVAPSLAQSSEGEIRITSNGSFQYLVPDGWEVKMDENGIVVMGQNLDDPDSPDFVQVDFSLTGGLSLGELVETLSDEHLEFNMAESIISTDVIEREDMPDIGIIIYMPTWYDEMIGQLNVLDFGDGDFGIMGVIAHSEYFESDNPLSDIEMNFSLADDSSRSPSEVAAREEGEIQVSSDGSFEYLLPGGWEVILDEGGIVSMGQNLDDPESPDFVQVDLSLTTGESFEDVAEAVSEAMIESDTGELVSDPTMAGEKMAIVIFLPTGYPPMGPVIGQLNIIDFSDGVFGLMAITAATDYLGSDNRLFDIQKSFKPLDDTSQSADEDAEDAAQDGEGGIQVSADGKYEYLVPDGWEVTLDDGGIVIMGQNLDDPESPDFVQVDFSLTGGQSLEEVAESVGDDMVEFDSAESIDSTEIVTAGSPDVAILIYTPTWYPVGMIGQLNILDFGDGDFGIMGVVAYPEYFESDNPLSDIQESFRPVGFEPESDTEDTEDTEAALAGMMGGGSDEAEDEPEEEPQEMPRSLTDFSGDWRDAIAELQDFGIIGVGGNLVFNEPRAFYSGAVTRYTPLARNSPFADIVMAGTIDFTTSDGVDNEVCSLFAGTQLGDPSQPLNTYIQVALVSNGALRYIDLVDGERENGDIIAVGIDLDEPHHIMFIIQDGVMVVYLDGELQADDLPVVDRAGAYGIALHGETSDASCEGSNIWVYQAPVVTPGVCEVTSGSAVNKRTGPGTEFSVGGQFNPGTYQQATGQAEDNAGFTWWQLEDGTWVREDVVTIQGDCASVPEVEP